MNCDEVEKALRYALAAFVGHKNVPGTRAAMISSITGTLHRFMSSGDLNKMPLIDINHEKEIAHLRYEIQDLERKLTYGEDTMSILNSIRFTNSKIRSLRDEVTDPSSVVVFFKNEDFSPFTWEGSAYDRR